MHRWKPKNSGSELAGILFDLYFEVRNLVEGLKPKIRQASWERTSIFRYTELFEPFIIYWLRLSQLHVRHCISVSLKKDTLSPVKSDELYSISVRDVFKTLVESIESGLSRALQSIPQNFSLFPVATGISSILIGPIDIQPKLN